MTSVNQEPPKQDPPGLITSPDASADLLANSLGDYLRIVSRRIRSGEVGTSARSFRGTITGRASSSG